MRSCIVLSALAVSVAAQIPDAPLRPNCPVLGSCQFKQQISGTPTSVVGNRVVLFDRTMTGGHVTSRQYLRDGLTRLQGRYGFDLVMTQDTNYLSDSTLATAKVVILAHGDGIVLPPGPSRMALENFVQTSGWGLVLIHSACAFVTGWPFMENACVQQYYTHNGSGTVRRMFKDSGTTADPNHGKKSPYSDFLLRGPLPGWGMADSFRMADEWWCTRAPARNTLGVNVLFGYDVNSSPTEVCSGPGTTSSAMNMVWTRMMDSGITVVNTWGHDETMYSGYGNFGDTLLWRFMRYAAKDWENAASGIVGRGSGETGFRLTGSLVNISVPGKHALEAHSMTGRLAGRFSGTGKARYDLSVLPRGVYLVRIALAQGSWSRKVVLP